MLKSVYKPANNALGYKKKYVEGQSEVAEAQADGWFRTQIEAKMAKAEVKAAPKRKRAPGRPKKGK